jgi:hypothetical protein
MNVLRIPLLAAAAAGLAGCGGGADPRVESAAPEPRASALALAPERALPAATPFSPPITITQGGVYSGNWESTDPAVPAVRVLTTQPVTLINSRIRAAGHGIWALAGGADVTVKFSYGWGLNPNVAGMAKNCFLDIGNFKAVRMENNRIEAFACGLRALNYEPDLMANASGQVVMVRFNQFRNIDGRLSNGQGGWQDSSSNYGHIVQLNEVPRAVARIEWNEAINLPGQSQIEDGISTYQSGGTEAEPIVIANNYVQGGYHGNPTVPFDYSGVMINLGDCPTPRPTCAHVHAYRNVVVSFSNGGMSIVGGHHMRLYDNRAVSARNAPGGALIGGTWRTGFSYWNYYGSTYWASNAMHGNYSLVVSRDGRVAGNHTPDATAAEVYDNPIDGTPGQLPTTTVDTRREGYERELWAKRRKAAGVTVGPGGGTITVQP